MFFACVAVTSCVGLISVHAWLVRDHLSAVQFSETTRWCLQQLHNLFRPCMAGDGPLAQRLRQVRRQRFNAISSVALHSYGVAMAALLVFTDAFSRLDSQQPHSEHNKEAKLISIALFLYVLLLVNYYTRESLTSSRILLCSAANLVLVTMRMLSCVNDPTFFILRANDFMMRLLTSVLVMDFRYAFLGNVLCSLVCCMSYHRNVEAFQQHVMWDDHQNLFMFWEWSLYGFACCASAALQYGLTKTTMTELNIEELKAAMHRVLNAFCDAQLYLDAQLNIQSPDEKLNHIFGIRDSRGSMSLQGRSLLSWLASAEDKDRFCKLVLPKWDHVDDTFVTAASAVNIKLRNVQGEIISAQICHTPVFVTPCNDAVVAGELPFVHLLGIRCAELTWPEATPCAAEEDDSTVPGSILQSTESRLIASLDDLPSVFGADNSQIWRCPYCNAATDEWGEVASVYSQESLATMLRSIRSLPHGSSPGDGAIVSAEDALERMQSLHEWAGDIFTNLMHQKARAHNNVCMAADVLENVALKVQAMSDICHLQLLGKRLGDRCTGLDSIWWYIVWTLTGFRPLSSKFTQTSKVTFWFPPSFLPTEQWVTWWELSPAQTYQQLCRDVHALAQLQRRSRHESR